MKVERGNLNVLSVAPGTELGARIAPQQSYPGAHQSI